MKVTIELRGVTFRTGTDIESAPIIRDVSLSIPEGSTEILMGPSGSGKTIMLKILAGILVPSAGNVMQDDVALDAISERERAQMQRRTGFVFQDAALWQNLDIRSNLLLATTYHEPRRNVAELEARMHELCRRLGYDDSLSARPAMLSAGERKIASIVRALMPDPEVLFLDEPTAGLDTEAVGRLFEVIRAYRSAGRTIVASSHDARIASQFADSVSVVDSGAIIARGTLSELARTEQQRVREILADVLNLTASYDADILGLIGSTEEDLFG